jgi:hypothetical protein
MSQYVSLALILKESEFEFHQRMLNGFEFDTSYYDEQIIKVLDESTAFYHAFPGFISSSRFWNLETGYPKLFLRIHSVHMKKSSVRHIRGHVSMLQKRR